MAVGGEGEDGGLDTTTERSCFAFAGVQGLHAHLWPGNEAELRSVLGALSGPLRSEPVQPAELLPLLQQKSGADVNIRTEKDRIVDALWRHGFSRTRAAQALGMSRKTLYNKIKRFGLSG